MNSRMQPPPHVSPGGEYHGDRGFDAGRDDPYHAAGKYREPTRCGDCGLVFLHGRWTRGTAPAEAHAATCPACHRVRDKLPAGTVSLEGPFVALHRKDLLDLIRHEAEQEGREHPLNRLMEVRELAETVHITTTDIHLPRRIGTALKRAYDGDLDVRFGDDEYAVRVRWHR